MYRYLFNIYYNILYIGDNLFSGSFQCIFYLRYYFNISYCLNKSLRLTLNVCLEANKSGIQYF